MNTERLGFGIFFGGVMLLIGVWMLVSALVLDRAPGVEYVEITREIEVYHPRDAGWVPPREVDGVKLPGQWVEPFPKPAPEWDEVKERWVHTIENVDALQPVDTAQLQPRRVWQYQRGVSSARAGDQNVHFDWSRTLGLWFGAICTLFVFSFLYRDNPFYKFTEALVVGVSAAYSMVVGFWTMVMPNLVGKLWPSFVAKNVIPEHGEQIHPSYIIVAVLGVMLLWRLSPVGGWIARWPLAFIIGITAGLRLIAHLQADFAIQIQATIMPLVVMDDGFSFWFSLRNLAIVLGVMACLTYFFFSIEHKGLVGRTARIGIWVLMITFGAGFAYTVMGRITLLTQRIEFLFGDWLRLIG
jgi:hypothetical protein